MSQAAIPDSTRDPKNTKRFWISFVVAFVVSALVLAGIWFFTAEKAGSGGSVAASTRELPYLSSAAKVDADDQPIHFAPAAYVSDDGSFEAPIPAVRTADLVVVVAQDEGGSNSLVALKDGEKGLPYWTAPLSDDPGECALQGDLVVCANGDAVEVNNGWPASLREDAAVEDAGTQSAESSGGQGQSGAEEAEQFTSSSTVILGQTATEDVPWAVDGTSLLDDGGKEVSTVSGGVVWALNPEEVGGDTWVFSDGQTLFGVRGDQVVFEVPLTNGEAELNSLVPGLHPTWWADSATLILADAEGVFALDLRDGEELWRVSAPVDAWMISGEDLIISSAGSLYVMQFPQPGSSQSQQAQSGSLAEQLADIEVPVAATYEDFANGDVQVPAWCAGFALGTDEDAAPSTMAFTNGKADGADPYAGVTLLGAGSLYSQGQPFAVAGFSCNGGGIYVYQEWGIYDADMNLIEDRFMIDVPTLGGNAQRVGVSSFTVTGSTFTYELEGIGLTGGSSQASAPTGGATVTWGWDGTEAQLVDLVYDLPTGTARQPDQEKVQEIYDLLANEDPAAQQYISDELAEDMKTGFGDQGRTPYIDVITPVGGTVNQCILGGEFTSGQSNYYEDSEGVQFPFVEYTEAGTFLCGIEVEGWSPTGTGDDRKYQQWMVVESDEEGNPFVVTIDRTFS